MPRPPGPEERSARGGTELSLALTGVTSLVRNLLGVVGAERSLAETRHKEILAKLQQQMDSMQSNLTEENRHLLEIENTLNRQQSNIEEENQRLQEIESTQKGIETSIKFQVEHGNASSSTLTSSSATVSANQDTDTSLTSQAWSKRASQIQNDSKGKEGGQFLAADSKFQFGEKYEGSEGTNYKTGAALFSHHVRKLCNHHRTEFVISGLIVLNALIMCAEVQDGGIKLGRRLNYAGIEAYEIWPGSETMFRFFDWFFGVIFCGEAFVKVLGFRLRYFCNGWNWVDFSCVVSWLVGKLTEALKISAIDGSALRMIRLVRLARLVRLIRTMEKLDMLYIITTAIKGMQMIVVWAVALLALMLMTCALFLSEYLHSTYFTSLSHETATPEELATYNELYKYFGSFTRCFLSMFEITLANWPPVARLLTEEVSEWFGVLCVLHKLTIGFAVIGVINGVILQETFKVAHTDDMVMVRQKKRAKIAMQAKMEALFQALDFDRDGEIGFTEFMVIAAQPEVKLWLESLDIETDDLLTLFLLIDADGNGTLTLDELLKNVPRLRGGARGIDMLAVRKNIPPFMLTQADDNDPTLMQWSENIALPQDTREAITETKFAWNGAASESARSLDFILKRSATQELNEDGTPSGRKPRKAGRLDRSQFGTNESKASNWSQVSDPTGLNQLAHAGT